MMLTLWPTARAFLVRRARAGDHDLAPLTSVRNRAHCSGSRYLESEQQGGHHMAMIEIEVEETGPDKWTATHPSTGKTETRRTKWMAVQAVVNKIVDDEATAAAVRMHGHP